jgi:hypothetical protein
MRTKTIAGWPFWLLIAAWVCANTPPALTCDAVAWITDAAHFSHQGRLRADVALILAGRETAPLFAFVRSAPPARPVLPHVPPETLAKKIDLCVPSAGRCAPPAARARRYADSGARAPDCGRAEPPHEPPRARVLG